MYLNKSLPITIASGHAGNAGATGCGYREEVLAKELVGIICSKFKELGFDIRDVSPTGSYGVSEQLVAEYTNANKVTNAQLHICVHFNASNGQGHGTETWIYAEGNTANAYATQVNNAIAKTINLTNRGVKASGNSLCIPRRVNAPTILIEIAFIDNQGDMDKYIPNKDKVASTIVEALTGQSVSTMTTTNQSATKNNEFNEEDYPMYLFSENWYRFRYKDVDDAIKKGSFKSGYEHYIKHGIKENPKRQPVPPIPINFNEGDYLELNQDIKKAVSIGSYVSGIHHFMLHGFKEPNRKINKGETDEAAKKRIAELEAKLSEIKKIAE